MTHPYDSDYWRNRAEEVRAQASEMRDEHVRRALIDVAENYDQLAEQAEQLLRRAFKSRLSLPAGELVAVARFQVAADGATTVDLTGPTTEPKLNDLLLATLRRWRFAPAYQSGRAVDSTLELRLTISVQ